MNKLYKKVLKKITPSKKEVRAEQKLVEEIRATLSKINGKHSHIEWCGSSARGTHLKGDRDIDLFLMFHKTLPSEELESEGLRIAKKLFGKNKWELAYSQHPYVRGMIKGFEVEIVPSYLVASGAEKQSAVDRTPFHNKYLLEKLSEKQKQEARLLKQFLKGINSYGADLKNCALPGYGVELLIVAYGNFESALKNISSWKPGKMLLFGADEEISKRLFEKSKYPLVIIDPVDSNRNVASALSPEQFERMVLAARLFLEKPSMKFFFPSKKKTWPKKRVSLMLSKKELLAIKMNFPKNILSDLFWGQLRRTLKKAENYLRENDFELNRSALWGDEKRAVLLFELEELNLQKAKKVFGPFASDKENTKRFLEKKRKILSGPRIENGRMVIETEREETSAEKVLKNFLKEGSKIEKGALKTALKKASVLNEKKILSEYKGAFAEYLTNYLEGKESFE